MENSPVRKFHLSHILPIGLIALIVLGATLVPLWHAQSIAGDRVFTGASVDTVDHGFYLALMQQGANGAWATINQFTIFRQTPHLLHLFYVTLGHVGKLLNIGMPVMYHLGRLACGFALILVVWNWLRRNVKEPAATLATLVVFTSSGLGWISTAKEAASVDLWFAETNTFLTMYYWPHMTWALLLKVTALLCMYNAREKLDPKLGLYAGLACLFLAFDHTFDLLGIAIVMAGYTAARLFFDKKLGRPLEIQTWIRFYAATAIVALPAVSYVWMQARGDDLMLYRMGLNQIEPVPSFAALFYGYGFLLPFAAIPAILVWQEKWVGLDRQTEAVANKRSLLFLYCWAVLNLLSMYVFQSEWYGRRLVLGAHLPIAILAALGAAQLTMGLWKYRGKAIYASCAIVFAGALALTQFTIIQSDFEHYDLGTARNCRFFLTQEEIGFFRDLGKSTPQGYFIQPVPGILTNPDDPTSLIHGDAPPDITMLVYGPWLTGHQEFVGHPWESPKFGLLLGGLKRFRQRAIVQPIPPNLAIPLDK